MKYIVHTRFKQKALCGHVNLPALTECESVDGNIIHNGKTLCRETSLNAHKYFARNNDGHGVERGRLTQAIIKLLSKRDDDYQKRWDNIWADSRLKKFQKDGNPDVWIMNHLFYNAAIEDLQYIATLIGLKTKEDKQ